MRTLLKTMVALSLVASPAFANLTSTGPPIVGSSWNINITYTHGIASAFPIDTFESFIVFDNGAGPFEGVGMRNNTAGWASSSPNANYSIMQGAALAPFSATSWDYYFAGNFPGNTVSINFLGWSGGVFGSLDFAARFDYVNGSFSNLQQDGGAAPNYSFLQDPTGVSYNRSAVVPEPTSLALLLGLGLGLVAARKLRKPTV